MSFRCLIILCVCCFATRSLFAADDTQPIDFNRDIRPILSDTCFACHGPDANTREAELRLDLEDAVFAKREKTLIARGNPAESELHRRISSTDDDVRMPPPDFKKQLTEKQRELITRWIEQGAKWATHWAYVPPQKWDAPAADDKGFVRNDVDRFILARLKSEGLQPAQIADDVTLVRRLFFDLIGLPPKPADVTSYIESKDQQKYEKLVDRLLASNHFGERLAIYWLDVVRFADSNGYHSDEPRQIAPYRDYVISAFNENKPYDQFIIEQLAGDLLPEPTVEQQVASGFNMLLQTTSEGGAQAKEYLAKYMADRVRNTSQIFLGSTMGCCECHDHKYDPFTMKDFYSFGAFFADVSEIAVGNPKTYVVMTEARKQKLTDFDTRIAELNKIVATPTPELAAAQSAWEVVMRKELETAPTFGPWHAIGPFKAASFEEAYAKQFGPESDLELTKEHAGQKWRQVDAYVDGKPHAFTGDNSALYLFRTVRVSSATELELSLGSDDSLTVWLNGKKVHDNKVLRGVAPDQDKIKVQLVEGENQLLMKVANGSGGAGFFFNAKQLGLPPNIAAIIDVAADERNDKQKNELAAHYRSIAPLLNSTRTEIAKVAKEKDAYNKSIPKTLMTKAVKPRMIRLLPRGNWLDDSGPETQPAIPEFLGGLPIDGRRANRLDLAKWIVDRNNPLTARTMMNRLWKMYFGHGLATPLDDLGRQGTLPTHPKLLDHLAIQLMDSNWNIKQMVRLLVTSGTYRQDSKASKDLAAEDPYNQLYARQSRFRLDAEIVRDNALALSGLLVTQVGGRSVYPYQPAGYWRHMNFPTRTWPASQGESLYRRGLYTWWQRMFLHPSMVAFDAPSREECTVERPRSNIPQQALVLLNDPTYVEAARSFGQRIVTEGGDSFESRLNWAYRTALSRSVSDREASVLKNVFDRHLKSYQADEESAKKFLSVGATPLPDGVGLSEVAAWTSISRIILNLHETITRS